ISSTLTLEKMPYLLAEDDEIQIPFGSLKKREINGNVTSINASEVVKHDGTQSIYGVLNGRVPGVFGNLNIKGYRNNDALIVVDGIPRPANTLNLQEIESISVVRDIGTSLFYGGQASGGVIFITTKRGKPYQREFQVTAGSSINPTISTPEFLSASEYMSAFNEALANDGLAPRYSQEAITNTANGNNPALYPDQDYYNSTYLKNATTSYYAIAEAGGGNDKATYYANLGYNQWNGLFNIGDNEAFRRINVRGNVDYELNEYITFGIDGIAVFDMYTGPNMRGGGFFYQAANVLPNAYPFLIDTALLDQTQVQDVEIVDDNKVYGGSRDFNSNPHADLLDNGEISWLNRTVQFNTGLDFDLNSLVEGLTGKAYLSFDIYNSYTTENRSTSYAVFEPLLDENGELYFDKLGEDNFTSELGISSSSAFRRIGFYGLLDYKKQFGDQKINITGLGYRSISDGIGEEDNIPGEVGNNIQPIKHLHFGLRANYSMLDKYMVDLGLVYAGTPYLEDNRYSLSPTLGVGWVLTEEDFLSSSSFVNYLKLKANWALMNYDNGLPFYGNSTTYQPGGNYAFGDGLNTRNAIMNINTMGNSSLGWGKMNEINVGFDAFLADILFAEFSFFSTKSSDNVARLSNTYSDIAGVLPYENNNTYKITGIELGLEINKKIGSDIDLTVGSNIVYATPKWVEIDELNRGDDDDGRIREGEVMDAIYGFESDGLYGTSDFTTIDYATQTFELNDGLAKPINNVQPGDIKYIDQNNDGIINDKDQVVIGNYDPRLQYSLHFLANYKNTIELFVMTTGRIGKESMYSNSYYWIYGDRKYSEVVEDRYSPSNQDVGASYPRLTTYSNNHNFQASDFWMEKANYFKIHTVQLTYTLPSSIAKNGYLKDFKVFVRGSNLLTVSGIKDKMQLNIGNSPQSRSFTLGINARF
ncbi:MAG: SusC/RagA family TonB-linked outer membrane protein, partial [Bacteroidales bacterium]|nr:SusC/RagA family TonB-linked outer membrane protein [Bacteroidales bacterium]